MEDDSQIFLVWTQGTEQTAEHSSVVFLSFSYSLTCQKKLKDILTEHVGM